MRLAAAVWQRILEVFMRGGALLCVLVGLAGCGAEAQPEVVIYVSVDQVYAEPVLRQFEADSGIRVKAVYDVEAAKTTGLVNRLLAEQARPLADVFWSGEFAQTILLKESGVLSAYRSPQAESIPEGFKDAAGYWTGFGGRARILLVNTEQLAPADYPASIEDLLAERYPAGRIGLAYPLFGTMSTHAAALYAAWGPEAAWEFFQALAERGVGVVDGNSVVKERVASGEWMFGLTDSDDACQAIQRGLPVAMVFPDQQPGGLGTLIIPNSVALIAGGAHPDQGQALVDYLLSAEVEAALIQAGWIQFPLRPVEVIPACGAPVGTQDGAVQPGQVQPMQVDYAQVYQYTSRSLAELGEVFIR